MNIAVPRPIAVASTLLWLAAGFLFLVAVSSIMYVTSPKSPQGPGALPLALWAAGFGLGGFALRGKRWRHRWWALGLCLSSVAALFLFLTPMTLIVLVLSTAALALVLLDRRKSAV